MGIRWLGGRGLHTTIIIGQIFLRVALNVASGLMFVADICAVTCRPFTLRLWRGFDRLLYMVPVAP